MTRNAQYEEILKTIPVGLQKAVLREMTYHIGAANGIERGELLRRIHQQPTCQASSDRQMRLKIQHWRSQGVRICHIERQVKEPNKPIRTIFIYYIAANDAEYQEFRAKYKSYADTINNEVNAMDAQVPMEKPKVGDVKLPPAGVYQAKLTF